MMPLLLLGLCSNLFMASLFSLLQFFMMALQKEFPSDFWFGHFRFITPKILSFFLPFALCCWLWAIKLSSHLQVLEYGLDFALGLGKNVNRSKVLALILVFLSNGVVFSFFGPLTFLGLLLPHMIRSLPWMRLSLRREILYGGFLSGILIMGLDLLCFLYPIQGMEIPVGLVTSIVGPFFMLMILVVSYLKKNEGEL
jgi:iron complex transport system permease protein